eukprot:848003-Pelagomonas_calceolata.AAC.3
MGRQSIVVTYPFASWKITCSNIPNARMRQVAMYATRKLAEQRFMPEGVNRPTLQDMLFLVFLKFNQII